jgi:prolipoprotein diacylglyceryltransferase
VLFHPTFLYEIVWNLIGFAILLLIDKRYNLRWGRLFGSYLVIYSIGRSFIESIRIDPSDYYFGLRTNVWSAIFGILAGLALIWWSRRTHTGLETSVYLAGREPQVEPQSKANERQDEKSDALDSESTKAPRSDSKS